MEFSFYNWQTNGGWFPSGNPRSQAMNPLVVFCVYQKGAEVQGAFEPWTASNFESKSDFFL